MTLSQFLHAAADAVSTMEAEPMEPYSDAVYQAAAEALQEAQEVQQ
jgi:hypothetical protein